MSGTRNLSDNLSDLKAQVWISHPLGVLPCWMPEQISLLAVVSARKLYACVHNTSQQAHRQQCALQVAANNKGIRLVQDLIEEYGLPTVQAYMHHIQASS
jgi:hypothetical protein